MSVHKYHFSTYKFVRVHTGMSCDNDMCFSHAPMQFSEKHIQQSTALVQWNDLLILNYKKCDIEVILVHTGAYWYITVLVHIGTDINYKHNSFESGSIGFATMTPMSFNCTLNLSLVQSVLLQGSVLKCQIIQV